MKFAITLWSPAQVSFDLITWDIGAKHKVLSITDYVLTDEDHAKLVRNIYSCDDVSPDKIEIKLGYMKLMRPRIRYLIVDFEDPRFREKKMTGKPLSMTGEDLKTEIRNKYRRSILNYFPDVIIHACDNQEQTDFVMNLFEELNASVKPISITRVDQDDTVLPD
jgi:hypothetical protein